MQFTYVESCDTYSTYLDDRGAEVYFAHGPGMRRLVNFDDIDLRWSWLDYAKSSPAHDRDAWLLMLARSITEPDLVVEIAWCEHCRQPMLEGDSSTTQNGNEVCEECVSNYTCCNQCDELARDTTTTLDNDEICESCLSDYYSSCEQCDGYYRDSDEDNHEHNDEGGCNCESPAQRFSVRNDGEARLDNDERVTVTLPAGIISPEGLRAISRYLYVVAQDMESDEQTDKLYNMCGSDILTTEIGATWQTRQGNFTKRLSRYAYKMHGLKLSPEVVSRVGCIARDNSTAIDFHLEVTRDLNLSAEDFGNDDSCWWQSYQSSRCALKTNGGYGLRTFGDGYGYVTGRSWVMPLRREANTLDLQGVQVGLTPTFNTDADAFVVFNGYGDLSGYVAARIMAHMAGMTYRKISFGCAPMYINGGSGYLVAPEEIAEPYTDGSLHLTVDEHSNLYDFETERKELANVA